MHRTIKTLAFMALVGLPVYAGASSPSAAMLADDKEHKHGEGEKHKLGRQTIGEYTVSVIMIGEAEAGKTVEFDIKLIDAKTDPKAMRVWVGGENASATDKATAVKGEKTYDADATVPTPLPNGAKVWVELETDKGVVRGSYEMKHDHKH
jgi:hypothetical protein